MYCYHAAPRLTFCCEAASEIVGVCFGYPSSTGDATAILEGLAVRTTRKGRGVGTRMLAHFEEAAGQAGYTCVQLGAIEGAATRFYLRRGYRIAAAGERSQAAKHIVLFRTVPPQTRKKPEPPR
jgi:GNAT superfamily N-acetyltransferase